jgi:hypothetical protein
MDIEYNHFPAMDKVYQSQIKSILSNDYHFTQLENLRVRPEVMAWRNWMKGKPTKNNGLNAYVKLAQQQGIQPAALTP